MAVRCRAVDWAATPLGPAELWPDALRTAVRLMLASPNATSLWCGTEYTLLYNDAYRSVLGAKHPAALGRSAAQVWGELWSQIGPQFAQVRDGGQSTYVDEVRFVIDRADGGGSEEAWFMYSGTPLTDETGAVLAVYTVVVETTKRVQLAADIAVERERLRSVILNMPAPLALFVGPEHRYQLANDAYLRVSGPRPEMLGRTLREAFPELAGQGLYEQFDRVYETGEPWLAPETLVRYDRDGLGIQDTWFDLRLEPIRDADGQVSGILNLSVDVTDQVRARRAVERFLTESEENRRAVESINVQLQKQAFELELSNQQLQEQAVELGAQAEELQATASQLEERTEEAEAERARAASILESIADAHFALDSGFRFVAANGTMERSGGIARPALLGHTIWELFPGTVGTDFERYYRQAVTDRREAHFTHDYSDGRLELVVDVDAYPAEGGGVAVFWRDVTERERSSAEREQAREEVEAANAQLQEQALELELTNQQLQDNASELEMQAEELQATASALEERTADAERAVARVTALQSLTEAFSAAIAPTDVAAAFLDRGTASVGAKTGIIMLLNAERSRFETAWGSGYTADVLEQLATTSADGPFTVNAAIQQRAPQWIHSREELAARFPGAVPLYEAGGFAATATVPLIAGDDRVMGALAFNFGTSQEFSADERVFIESLGRQIAQALDRSQIYEAEQAARREAEEANASKSRFLANMSHELRQPLNAITGYSDLIVMGVRGPITEQQRNDLLRIKSSSTHLTALISDILEFAKIEAGQLVYNIDRVSVGAVLSDVGTFVARQVATKRLRYTYEPCPNGMMVSADRDRFTQAVLNLVTNATKYTLEGGSITLSCTLTGPEHNVVAVRVTDTGIGIPKDKQLHIFEPFVQAHRALSRPAEGAGLGLAIARDVARHMGGDLTVESEDGVGSTFTLTLPAA